MIHEVLHRCSITALVALGCAHVLPAAAQLFGPEQVINGSALDARYARSADLDGDGDLDVISTSYADNTVAWYANNGAGGFGPEQVISSTMNWASIAQAGDVDGDGDLDVVAAAYQFPSRVSWFTNDGTGQFTAEIPIDSTGVSPTSMALDDVDGDGDPDLLVGFWTNNEILLYYNVGGGFGPAQVVDDYFVKPISLELDDLDGDTDLDLLAAATNEFAVYWFENDGTGGFGTQILVSDATPGVYYATSGDLDGDGDQDVVSASYNDDRIAWYANDGSGGFGAQQTISVMAPEPWALACADFDADGDVDLATAFSDDIVWFANSGTGVFAPLQIVTATAMGVRFIHAADLDGDTDVDLLSASWDDNTIAWYANTTTAIGVSEHVPSDILRVVPSPMRDHARIILPAGAPDELLLTTVTGRIVRAISCFGRREVELPRGDLAPGVYAISAAGNTSFRPVRLVVQ